MNNFGPSAIRLFEPIHKLVYSRYKNKITDIGFHGDQQGWIVHVEEGRIPLPKAEISFATTAYFNDLCKYFSANLGIRFDKKLPIVACKTPDGDRFHAVVGDQGSSTGLAVAIRVKRRTPVTWDNFEVTERDRGLIGQAMADGKALALSGSTGSGKTTLMNMIINNHLPRDDFPITIEDTPEIELPNHPLNNQLYVARIKGESELTWEHQIDNCLRLNPDVIIPGELSIMNAFPFYQAIDTGHDSTIFTMHANSPADAVTGFRRRIALGGAPESETNSAEEFLAETFAYILQVKHLRHDGASKQRRVVTDVARPKEVLMERRKNAVQASGNWASPEETMEQAADRHDLRLSEDERESILEEDK